MEKWISTALAITTSVSLADLNATTERVYFNSQGSTLVGTLFLPEDYSGEQALPAVIVTGAWTTVKEQMPSTYAKAMADQGYAALAFDFRGWGESKDSISFLEDPSRKTEDIVAAAEYLAGREDVKAGEIFGLGICASAGYMIGAANQSTLIGRITLVAPWLHNAEIVEQVYGGKEGVVALIESGREAENASAPVYLEAASTTNENALMFQAPYYTEPDRGAIPAYDNQFNVASWEAWLTYDAVQSAVDLKAPVLIVHSEAAAIPQGAHAFIELGGDLVNAHWLDGASQFDFYDQPGPVSASVKAAAFHFGHPTATDSARQDEAAIRSIMEGVASLADLGAFDILESLYSEEVLVDYTSLSGGDPEMKSNRQLMTEWASVLPGFEQTQHALSNIQIMIGGDAAEGTAEVTADHYINGRFWQVSGRYQYSFIKGADGWKITRHTFILNSERGTREVFGLAVKETQNNPSPYLLRAQTRQAVLDLLTALEDKDMEKFGRLWAEDAVQEMPYAPNGFPHRVVGKAHLMEHYSEWPKISGQADFTSELRFFPMQDPRMVFAEWKGRVDILSTGRVYEQKYGGLFHVDGGKIQLFREYFNPIPFAFAFGLDETGS